MRFIHLAALALLTSTVLLSSPHNIRAEPSSPTAGAESGGNAPDSEIVQKRKRFDELIKRIDGLGFLTEAGRARQRPLAADPKILAKTRDALKKASDAASALEAPEESNIVPVDAFERLQLNQKRLTDQRVNDFILLQTEP